MAEFNKENAKILADKVIDRFSEDLNTLKSFASELLADKYASDKNEFDAVWLDCFEND
tara:strand:- start:51 stop:224 length:174 start_codon:yes stop_codon:yes gene_type:complete